MFNENLTGLVAVCLTLGMPIIIVIAVLIYKAHQVTTMRETIEYMVSKGQQVPPDLIANMQNSVSQYKSPMRTGIALTTIGLGLLIMFLTGSDGMRQRWGIAMVPLLLGLGFLLIWKLEGSNRK